MNPRLFSGFTWPIDPPVLLRAGIDKRGKRWGQKADSGRQCSGCRVTLAKDGCRNKMCRLYLK